MSTTGFRWKARHTVLLVLGITWVMTYVERTVMSVAMPYIAGEFHLRPVDTGIVLGSFYAGYAVFQVPGGVLADLLGPRLIATVSIVWRAVFVALTSLATTVNQLVAVRVLFGLGDGPFPAAATKSVAVWFPKHERTRANALMFAVMPLGTALAPLLAIPVIELWGWRAAFYALLGPGIAIAALFWVYVRNTPGESRRVSDHERLEISDAVGASDAPAPTARRDLLAVLKRPDVLGYFLSVLAYDTAYWGYWSWMPTYLVQARGFTISEMGVAASLPSFAGVLGCLAGGWISDRFFADRRRLPIVTTQLIAATLLGLTFTAHTAAAMVVYQAIGGFFLEAFFSTFWALPMTTIRKEQMGVASGFINMAGQIAAFVSPIIIGFLVEADRGGFGYTFEFLIASILTSMVLVSTLCSRRGRADSPG